MNNIEAATKITITPKPENIKGKGAAWDDGTESPAFSDMIDVVNPLQHIPIISTVYKAATGDGIGFVPRILGGALFGGIIGLIAGIVGSIVEEATGKDIGENLLAKFNGDNESDSDKEEIVATNDFPQRRSKGNVVNEYLTASFNTSQNSTNIVA